MTAFDSPPQSVAAERAVLGCCLLDENAAKIAARRIRSRSAFFQEPHQLLWDAISALDQRNEPVDPTTLTNELTRRNTLDKVGGAQYLADLMVNVSTTANLEYYLKTLLEWHTAREVVSLCQRQVGRIMDGTPAKEVLEGLERAVYRLQTGRELRESQHIGHVLDQLMGQIDSIQRKDPSQRAIPVNLDKLNELTGGLKPAELHVVAARPSVGKTSMMLNMAEAVAKAGHDVLIFSLEMTAMELAKRLLTMQEGIDFVEVARGNLARWRSNIAEAVPVVAGLPIYVDDAGRNDMRTMVLMARQMFHDRRPGAIFLDYIQQVKGDRRLQRHEQLGELVREFKAVAKDLGVPVVLLAQLSRQSDEEVNPARLHNYLKDSGDLEQEADVIITLSRPIPKKQKAYESWFEKLNIPADQQVLWYLNKNRNGKTGGAWPLIFKKNLQRFAEPYIDGRTQVDAGSDDEETDPLLV